MVGSPTPTGTLWPAFRQVPTPSSSFRSWPMRVTFVSTSGPLPMSVAPTTGGADLAVLDQVGLGRREDELAAGDVHLAAAEVLGVDARAATERMMSSGSSWPASMKVLVMRGSGMDA